MSTSPKEDGASRYADDCWSAERVDRKNVAVGGPRLTTRVSIREQAMATETTVRIRAASGLARARDVLPHEALGQGHGNHVVQTEASPQLPLWHDLERAMPNMIARSALFAPIARGRRAMHEGHEIACRSDVQILYSGRQLDMADADVFMQALEIAKRRPLGEPFAINRAEFLRAIKRPLGKSQYDWLDSVMKRLKFTTLTINHGDQLYELSLIAEWGRDKSSGEYVVMVSPKIMKMFIRHEFGLIDWESRFQIEKRVELAKWMQTYVASHARGREHRISMRYLHEWSGYKGPLRQFRTKLTEALEELSRVGAIRPGFFIRPKDSMVVYNRS